MSKHYSQKDNLITIMTEIAKKTPKGIMNGDTTVGHITWQMYLMRDYLKLDGTPLANASTGYAQLLEFAQNNNLITADTTDNSLFKYNSNTDVLTLPDYIDLCLQGGNSVEEKEAGLPNIKGTQGIKRNVLTSLGGEPTGALGSEQTETSSNIIAADTSQNNILNITFNAHNYNPIYSDSVTTVQPPAITLIPQIKYRKATTMYEQIDAVVNYSTTEKVIGTWIDGKPLYQKTYEITSPSTAGTAVSIISLDTSIDVVSMDGHLLPMLPLNFTFDSTNYVVTWQSGGDYDIYMKVSSHYVNNSGYITLQYTKTTD